MKEEFKCTLLEGGIGIEIGVEKFVISYDEHCLPWGKATKWCREKGGKLPSIKQLMTIHEHRPEINAMLKRAKKETLNGWYWSEREHPRDAVSAWYVGVGYGNTAWTDKYTFYYTRAVYECP
ncbi:DUF1566 domain-containing protein [Alistipes sp. OttesenSCG-928-L06]|nr:DUF1566 domain-containing protein [Alistipes sp. OttesenSCG-928-L06]